MEFTLCYKGIISSNGTSEDKHHLRCEFHRQLKLLWTQLPPLKHHKDWLISSKASELHKAFGNKKFMCLVSNKLNMFVELSINLYAPLKNRSLKDIDNKLKTIFDSLQIPRQNEHIPISWNQTLPETPLICLLSDDKLIYKVDIDTDYIIEGLEKDQILCLIKVKVKGNKFISKYKDLII